MTPLKLSKEHLNGHVAFRERRPGVLQVVAPLFHEDGDMADFFLDEPCNETGKFRVGHHGMTTMWLTYSFDVDTDGRLYRETKGSDDADELRGRERRKIECGKAHFSALGVDYKVVTSHNEV
jgi:hypothetical protein